MISEILTTVPISFVSTAKWKRAQEQRERSTLLWLPTLFATCLPNMFLTTSTTTLSSTIWRVVYSGNQPQKATWTRLDLFTFLYLPATVPQQALHFQELLCIPLVLSFVTLTFLTSVSFNTAFTLTLVPCTENTSINEQKFWFIALDPKRSSLFHSSTGKAQKDM